MAFEGLTEKLSNAFKKLRGKGRLSEADVKESMREIRLALLEADVNYKVVKDFIKKTTERCVGTDVLESLTPAQMIVKIVNEELTALMGSENQKIKIASQPPTVVMLVGLQGAGKTTFIRFLALEPEWFTDDVSKLDDKEIYHRLNGHWICELSEMVATANAKSIEEIKSFLSRDKDFLRMAYDRYGGDHPRQSVFAGTTNRMDFLPLDRSGNRRFLPVTVDASKADCHILDNPAESRHYFEQLWAEIMVQYKSGAYSTHLSKEDEDALRKQQQDYCQEDTLAGRIYAWFETFEQDKVCSLQIYRECLEHPFDEPKNYETREIREIVDSGIASGEISGWQKFRNARKFAKYGRQYGWERIPPPAQLTFGGCTVVDEEPPF